MRPHRRGLGEMTPDYHGAARILTRDADTPPPEDGDEDHKV